MHFQGSEISNFWSICSLLLFIDATVNGYIDVQCIIICVAHALKVNCHRWLLSFMEWHVNLMVILSAVKWSIYTSWWLTTADEYTSSHQFWLGITAYSHTTVLTRAIIKFRNYHCVTQVYEVSHVWKVMMGRFWTVSLRRSKLCSRSW